jgi:hypothetical protein
MLPKIDVPMYDLVLPLTKKKVRFRPFLVKEEKILLMAMEAEDDTATLTAVKQIINNCCLTEDLDVDSLPITDLEFFFLNLRARSVNEIVDLQYRCNNKVKNDKDEEKECGNVVKLEINVLEIEPTIPKNHTNKIELSSEMGLVMKYPTFKIVEMAEGSDIEKLMHILLGCVDYVYDKDNIYYGKDIPKKELQEFIENLTGEQFAKIQEFFDTMPKISKKVHFGCSKCGYKEDIVIEGIQNFFV